MQDFVFPKRIEMKGDEAQDPVVVGGNGAAIVGACGLQRLYL